MSQRMTRSDYLVVYLFIACMVVSLGTFFFGYKLGANQTIAKYEEIKINAAESKITSQGYSEQDLASFYHMVYQPFDHFWFELIQGAESKELSTLADKTYKQMSRFGVGEASPLLERGQAAALKSLRLYLEDDLKASHKARLEAQMLYYASIQQWEQKYVTKVKPQINLAQSPLSIQQWTKLTLHQKNLVVSQYLMKSSVKSAFLPQDLSTKVDTLIRSGEAKSLGIQDVNRAAKLLVATDSVKRDDFLKLKADLYPDTALPLIPFFQ
jgi:hypothetical protein